MPVFLLQEGAKRTEQGPLQGTLRARIPDLTELESFEQVFDASGRIGHDDPAIVIIPLSQNNRDDFERLVGFAAQHNNGFFLVLIGDEISASDYKRLVRSGAADWVSRNADPTEVFDIIARRQSSHDARAASASRPSSRRPVTVSFVPSAGGVGNSTLVVETAAAIKAARETRQRRICIVDLDFQSSHLCDYLDSEPRLQIADLSSSPERLDEHLFESFRTRHSSGIDVFAAPRSKFSAGDLNINALDALLSMIASQYDVVLIDYPVHWFHWTPQIIAACDGAVITSTNTIPCLRQVCETLALVRSSSTAALQVAVAINRCERTLFGSIARRKPVETVLPNERLFFIGNRLEAAESVNMGIPMTLGPSASKCRREFAPLAEFCSGLIDTQAVRG
jgi:Flp pilus assembly CpaE family ATPase